MIIEQNLNMQHVILLKRIFAVFKICQDLFSESIFGADL